MSDCHARLQQSRQGAGQEQYYAVVGTKIDFCRFGACTKRAKLCSMCARHFDLVEKRQCSHEGCNCANIAFNGGGVLGAVQNLATKVGQADQRSKMSVEEYYSWLHHPGP